MNKNEKTGNPLRMMTIFIRLLPLMLVLSTAAFASEGIRLTLKEGAAVDQDTVRLADIGSLAGGAQTQLEELGRTVVAKAPLPGQTRFVSLDYIRIRLRQAGFDTDAVTFAGPADVRITRQAATPSIDDIKRAVEESIRSRMPWKNETVTISDISFNEDIQLPTGRLTYNIVPNRNEDYSGRSIFALHFFVDGLPVRKVWVNATISVMAEVVTVIRPLGKHQKIELADLSVVRRDLADLSSDTVRNLEDALGNRTTRMIYPDTVLQTGMFVSPPVVRRGDIVKIVVNSGTMTITATGMVKQQGRKGEQVRVVNTDSNRIITARVTGPGAVEVDF